MGALVEAAALGSRFYLAFVLLAAALPKLFAPEEFRLAVENYRLLPRRFAKPAARWLPRLELLCSAALFVGAFTCEIALLVGALLSVFAVAVAINLLSGREIDCGCYGVASSRQIGWSLVVQDVALVALAVLIFLRAPSVLALDSLWRSHTGFATEQDALALLVASTIVALAEALARDVFRLHVATRAHVPRHTNVAS